MMARVRIVCLAVGGALVAAAPAAALHAAVVQERAALRLPPVSELLPPPHHDPELSLRLLDVLVESEPERLEWHFAVAREATALGITAETPEARSAALTRGIEAGRRAVELAPDDAEAHYWLAASLGLLADEAGGRTKISSAREAWQRATRALELDVDHGGAHHIVGRLHAGARRLSWMSRMIARGLGLGEVLNEASWESAEEHMRLAVARDPEPLVHHFELAKLLVETDRDPAAGRAILQRVAAHTPRHALDAHYVARAAALLGSVGPAEQSGVGAPRTLAMPGRPARAHMR